MDGHGMYPRGAHARRYFVLTIVQCLCMLYASSSADEHRPGLVDGAATSILE